MPATYPLLERALQLEMLTTTAIALPLRSRSAVIDSKRQLLRAAQQRVEPRRS